MKASTMFLITLALMLALGAVAFAKYAGWLEPKQQPEEAVVERPKILAANQNLFADIAVSSGQVVVRELYDHELADYNNNPKTYFPPLSAAATFRVARTNIPAGTPLKEEHFHELEIGQNVTERLSPFSRSVNVAVDKNEAAGGLIQRGEYVDVMLTCKICDGIHCDQAITQTTCIAKNCKVIAKRNTLFTVLAANPDNVPVDYTLQTNPYRAALINYAKNIGLITLTVNPSTETPVLPSLAAGRPSFSDPNSPEYRDEDERVDGIISGEYVVSEADLERVFRLRELPTPPPQKKPVAVERWRGLRKEGTTVFDAAGKVDPTGQSLQLLHRPVTERPSMGYRFHHPSANLSGTTVAQAGKT